MQYFKFYVLACYKLNSHGIYYFKPMKYSLKLLFKNWKKIPLLGLGIKYKIRAMYVYHLKPFYFKNIYIFQPQSPIN